MTKEYGTQADLVSTLKQTASGKCYRIYSLKDGGSSFGK